MKKRGISLMEVLASILILSVAMLSVLRLFLSSRATVFGEIANAVAYREVANFINLKHQHYQISGSHTYDFLLNSEDSDSKAQGAISLNSSDPEYDVRTLSLVLPFPTMSRKTEFKHKVEVYHEK